MYLLYSVFNTSCLFLLTAIIFLTMEMSASILLCISVMCSLCSCALLIDFRYPSISVSMDWIRCLWRLQDINIEQRQQHLIKDTFTKAKHLFRSFSTFAENSPAAFLLVSWAVQVLQKRTMKVHSCIALKLQSLQLKPLKTL